MAKKIRASKQSTIAADAKSPQPKNFSGVIRGCARTVQATAKTLRDAVYKELPEVEERFYGGRRPMAMYRMTSDLCWIQPQMRHCNIYFTRGHELTDLDELLEGTSKRFKHAKARSVDEAKKLPLSEWLQESVALNEAAVGDGFDYDCVLEKLREICLSLPQTNETLTWGIPHFRVGEKIFCGCAEYHGRPRIGLKMERRQSEVMMKLPGIEKSPYSRKGDGWVTIDPNAFDDWDEIEELLLGSFRLIAPKRVAALLTDE